MSVPSGFVKSDAVCAFQMRSHRVSQPTNSVRRTVFSVATPSRVSSYRRAFTTRSVRLARLLQDLNGMVESVVG